VQVALALTAVAALLTAGCSSDDGDDATATSTTAGGTSASSTTAPGPDAEEGLVTWSERGPYGVGSLELTLDGRRLVVWYPAEAGAGTEGTTDQFDIAGLLSPELQAQVPEEARPLYPVAARQGAEPDPSGGPYGVIVFSHGFAGFPEQSVDLTTHLASWGWVVAAPDHVERSLSGLLGTAAQGVTTSTDADVLAATLDLVVAEAETDRSPLSGLVDPERVVAAGHSAGAGASYRFAGTDPRVDAAILYSVGTGREGAEMPDPPEVPTMVMLGDTDDIIPADTTRELYGRLNPPRYLVEIADSGHLVFSDLCLIGGENGGLIGIAETIQLEIPEDFKRLGTDGCEEGDLAVTEAFAAVNGLSTAFLASVFTPSDATADALTSGPVTGLDGTAEVTLTADP
jgi:dienelactone hydrolase